MKLRHMAVILFRIFRLRQKKNVIFRVAILSKNVINDKISKNNGEGSGDK